jgi:hypothetical protein
MALKRRTAKSLAAQRMSLEMTSGPDDFLEPDVVLARVSASIMHSIGGIADPELDEIWHQNQVDDVRRGPRLVARLQGRPSASSSDSASRPRSGGENTPRYAAEPIAVTQS